MCAISETFKFSSVIVINMKWKLHFVDANKTQLRSLVAVVFLLCCLMIMTDVINKNNVPTFNLVN